MSTQPKATLRVDRGGVEYVYDDVQLVGDVVLEEELRDGIVEPQSVTIELFTDPDEPKLKDTFAGYASPAEVGEERLTAVLEFDPATDFTNVPASAYTMDGLVRRSGISGDRARYDDNTCRWSIEIEVLAIQLLEKALENIEIRDPALVSDIQAEGFWKLVEGTIRDEDGNDTTYDIRFWKVRDLLTYLLDQVSILSSYTLADIFRLDVEYDPSDPKTISRTPPVGICHIEGVNFKSGYGAENTTLPDWTGLDLWRALIDVHGWFLKGEHGPFPSKNISVKTLEVSVPLNVGVTNAVQAWLDGYELLHFEPEKPDLGLKYLNDPEGQTAFPREAVYAAKKRRINDEGKVYNETIKEVKFRLPNFVSNSDTTTTLTDGSYEEDVVTLTPLLKRELESDVYLAELSEVTGDYEPVVYRRVDDPTSNQPEVIGAIHMLERYPGHALDIASRRVIEGDIDLPTFRERAQSPNLLQVVDLDEGLQAESLDWIVQRREWNYDRDVISVEAIFPHPIEIQRIDPPPEDEVLPPENLEAYKQTTHEINSNGNYERSTWEVWFECDLPDPDPDRWDYQLLDSSSNILVDDDKVARTQRNVYTKTTTYDPPQSSPDPDPATYDDADSIKVRGLDSITGETSAYKSASVTELADDDIFL